MVKIINSEVYLIDQNRIIIKGDETDSFDVKKGKRKTIAYRILDAHNTSDNSDNFQIKFDALTSHDLTFVGIIQTARASGLSRFPLPYVLTNCHNSLCAVGGTINEDDHLFGLTAAQKYGGIYVPPHIAVIHQYMRERHAACGSMILGSDSHTRYGVLGTLGVGEGGGELVKQLLGDTWNIKRPEVVAVYLTGAPPSYTGPMDVALAIIGKIFESGFVKNRILEFIGDGVANLSVDFRNGIDVMTTETTCLSSVWQTDQKTRKWLEKHGRKDDYRELKPENYACYDGVIEVNLSQIEPMIAMPFHPSNVYPLAEVIANPYDILHEVEEKAKAELDIALDLRSKVENGVIKTDQGVIAGCSGGIYESLCHAADILDGHSTGNGHFTLSVYPSSQPVYNELIKNGTISRLMGAGAVLKTAFCGPCFGAGDIPANGGFAIRHNTRNFPNREGSKPAQGQMASVALMDAKSIAASAVNCGVLTSAATIDTEYSTPEYRFDPEIYEKRCFNGYGKPDPSFEIVLGPNITEWPEMSSLTNNILLKIASVITDPVTTTDELIPSGDTASYRSNPLGLAEFTLLRKDPDYVPTAKKAMRLEALRLAYDPALTADEEIKQMINRIKSIPGFKGIDTYETEIGSIIYAVKPGDGSAREQAASCQRVLGGVANIANEYATKRYRSNLINWGIIPFEGIPEAVFNRGDYLFIPDIRNAVKKGKTTIKAWVLDTSAREISLGLGSLTEEERKILLDGSLINFNKGR